MLLVERTRPGRRWPRVPGWLGWVVQRPESHCVHHQESLHSYNFGDLPIWDAMFGTLRNPERWESRCGFGETGELRLRDLLLGVDVARPEGERGGTRETRRTPA